MQREIDAALNAHGLIKVRVFGDDRDARISYYETLCEELGAAMAAGLALIPLALGGGRTGSEIQTPMAIVILWGLVSSTLLNMVVVPSLYLWLGSRPAPAVSAGASRL